MSAAQTLLPVQISRLEEEVARARRFDLQLAVIVADLDHFQAINDTHGFESGDLVLQRVASFARSALRQTDWIAGSGRQEFVIVLPETHATGAAAVAERMRRLCAETSIALPSGKIQVTASFGVATLESVAPSDSSADALLREADAALGRSKSSGRNRVTSALSRVKIIPPEQRIPVREPYIAPTPS